MVTERQAKLLVELVVVVDVRQEAGGLSARSRRSSASFFF
jgi:hypothetical protein